MQLAMINRKRLAMANKKLFIFIVIKEISFYFIFAAYHRSICNDFDFIGNKCYSQCMDVNKNNLQNSIINVKK